MAYMITAAQYRDEWITEFQRGETYLKDTTTPETVIEGHSSAVFAIAGQSSGMTSRGANGLIPTRNATDRQVTLTLKERHTLENQTGFNVFTAQGGGLRAAMRKRSTMDAAREIDDEILLALSAATNQYNSGSAIVLTYGKLVDIISNLWQNNVTDMITVVHTAKSWARMTQWTEFTNIDYVDRKPLMGDMVRPIRWANATHIMMPSGLTGAGTNSAKMYAYAKPALGHAVAAENIDVDADYNREQKYSWDRATMYHVGGILQQAGVLQIIHDDTASFS
jgi:hypothetical protein